MHHPGKSFHNYWTSCSGPQYFFPWFCVPNLTLRTPQSWCDWAQRTPSDGWDSQVTHSIRWWLHFSYGSITSESWRYLCFVCFFFFLLLWDCVQKQPQFALFSALALHTGILTIEAESAVPNFLLNHFLLKITGCLSCCYSSVTDMSDAVYSIWPYSVIWACPPSPQLQSSWSDRQVSKQPHSSLVKCTPSLAKSLSFQYLKPSSKKQICTASTLLCISSCAGSSHPHT